MTDARFPEKLLADRRLLRLTPVDFRSYTMATIWSVSNRTDGCILMDDLPLIPGFDPTSATRLVTAELWKRLGAGYVVIDFEPWQTSRDELEVLDNARRRDREKKARRRARDHDTVPPGSPPGHVPGTAQEGQARPGQEGQAATSDQVSSWPIAEIGQGKLAS